MGTSAWGHVTCVFALSDGRSVGRAFGGNQLPGAKGSEAGWCVGYPYLCYWGRRPGVVPWVYTCGSVCVLGVAPLVAWVSSAAAAAAAVSGSREQVNRRSPSGPGYRGRASRAARPEGPGRALAAPHAGGESVPPRPPRSPGPESGGVTASRWNPASLLWQRMPTCTCSRRRVSAPEGFTPSTFQKRLFSKVYAQVHVIIVSRKVPLNGD